MCITFTVQPRAVNWNEEYSIMYIDNPVCKIPISAVYTYVCAYHRLVLDLVSLVQRRAIPEMRTKLQIIYMSMYDAKSL